MVLYGVFISCEKDPGGRAGRNDGARKGEITVRGSVADEGGRPLKGVVVSDGFLSVVTDGSGRFEIPSDLKRRHFVQVSIPAGYEVPTESGLPQFFERIPRGVESFEADFVLNKIEGNADNYTLLMTADTQIRGRGARFDNMAFHSIDKMNDMLFDMNHVAASLDGGLCYGICLGDLIHNTMSLYTDYREGIATLSFPMFNVIGNHDHDQQALTDSLAMADYERNIGPSCYSFDLGRVHYVVLDDMIMTNDKSPGSYSSGLTRDVYEWLKGDLEHVDKNKILMVCAHSGLYMKGGGDPTDKTAGYTGGYTGAFSRFKHVHSWAGHNHHNFNYVYSEEGLKFPNVESHIVARATGALWLNERVSNDGTPRGYYVISVEGDKISWNYRPCGFENERPNGLSPDDQMWLYRPDQYGDGYLYANVWAWDALWDEVKYSDSGKNDAPMTRFATYDKTFDDMYVYYTGKFPDVDYGRDRNVRHMFRIRPSVGASSARVSVTDRFGKTYTETIDF